MDKKYDINCLPDFFSVRNKEQIDYAFEGMEDKQCFVFFDNGFDSTYVETNKRDIKYIWDGFLLFVDKDISIEDIKNGVNLHDARIMALQRTRYFDKANTSDVRNYILEQLQNNNMKYSIMPDKNEVSGYPAKGDMWSTRDETVLNDAIDCIQDGMATFYPLSSFAFNIKFKETKLPVFNYVHNGGIVLNNEEQFILIRILDNDNVLSDYIDSFNSDYANVEDLRYKK